MSQTPCDPVGSLLLSPDRHTARVLGVTLRVRSNLRHLLWVLFIHACAPLQRALLHWATGLAVRYRRCQRWAGDATSVLAVGSPGTGVLLRQMRDSVGRRVLATQTADERIVGLAGFGHGIVAGVEVFALLELVLEEVLLVGELAVETEELLLLFGEGLWEKAVSGGLLWAKPCEVRAWEPRDRTHTLTSTLFFWCGFIVAVECVRSRTVGCWQGGGVPVRGGGSDTKLRSRCCAVLVRHVFTSNRALLQLPRFL